MTINKKKRKGGGKEVAKEWGTYEEEPLIKRVFSLPGVKLSEQLGGICCSTFPL